MYTPLPPITRGLGTSKISCYANLSNFPCKFVLCEGNPINTLYTSLCYAREDFLLQFYSQIFFKFVL